MEGVDSVFAYLDRFDTVGDSIVAAIGTVVAAVLGVLSGVGTWVLSQRRQRAIDVEERRRERAREEAAREAERLEAERLRTERINDLVCALHAEILTGIVLYADQESLDEVRHTIFDLRPFATADETDFVFETVVHDLSILPSMLIHVVVAYYRAARQTNLMIRDFRDPLFQTQSAESKQRYLEGYIAMIFVLKERGLHAVEALADYAATQDIDLRHAEDQVRGSTAAAMTNAAATIGEARRLGPEISDNRTDGT
ncbi:hypothetical protein [Methylobrevis pamukkalensis]|uniref:Uncharacterized protein n=1 Tax=Methylobrevis pamukkalensis TaxID=1439726 RepID=A0A1E3H2A6_9HYPH|nr:hypothetical protein [Methylobrevis pamukkalensis]ODN69936.1 hypothetical protein A6302_02762 [Methylobrevis pamukkalensis]